VQLAWTPDNAMRVDMEGHGDARFAPVITEQMEALATPARKLAVFFDVWGMRTYDAAFRAALTSWVADHRDAIAEFHVGLDSKIVAMGVAVANLALGGLVQAHTDRAVFSELLRARGLSR
jgi:hypothetical protein